MLGGLRNSYDPDMAITADLIAEGFTASTVVAKTLDIDHPDPGMRGPFCRLTVTTAAPPAPGVYAWATDDDVQYIGKARELIQIVKGTTMGRAYNDYTYMPASKVAQLSNPRVRVNGLLNATITGGSTASWWWLELDSEAAALAKEAILIDRWSPPWNRARPTVL